MIARRATLAGLVGMLAAPALGQGIYARRSADGTLRFPADPQPLVDFERAIDRPVTIRSVEQWVTAGGVPLIRVTSADGAEGVVRGSTKAEETRELFARFAVPRFQGRDARQVGDLVRRAAREDYEFAGVPYWSAIGQVEVAIWDLLGKVAGRRCAEFIGPVLRETIPIYLSSNRRDTAPEAEVAHLAERMAETGAEAVKLKIGRRMGYNADAAPGRTERVIALARKVLGDKVTIYADANGAYDTAKALEVAAMLEDHGVAMLEEPCPPEDFEMTRDVTRAVRQRGMRLKVAGGENEHSLERWRWLTENRALDVIQPDPMYAGGIVRNLAIMRMGREAGLAYNPHFPRNGADTAPMLHLCAVSPNLWGYQEYRSRPEPIDFAHAPELKPVRGCLALPAGPGWGIAFDPAIWRSARRL